MPDIDQTCLFFHRTAVIMVDGEVVTCANFFAEHAGRLDAATGLEAIWNGPRMQGVRAAFGTEAEWPQCRNCWFREIKYHSQRSAWEKHEPAALKQGAAYTEKSWDFRRFSGDG
ncbi:SPASM domain-containing protein [Fertoebacter nigrum]|uniref:SPASM domain-containing protein n=1 Tax=Fertoeibacter niger TaxID=2656921 RepID=A0A8X8KNU1_9RHOB|nr:SPASM domain-containing protein [Fertoeibacter niger]NUB44151.1 SPASM domain-containing protein [Fertoeibacter niger]